MAELQKEAKHHLDKTTNTLILDYVLWLSAKTILEEAVMPVDAESLRTRGRRLVGLADGLILTFDITNMPKFSYAILNQRLDLAALVIIFVYRDSRTRYITRRSSELSFANSPGRLTRTDNFLRDRSITSVFGDTGIQSRFSALEIPAEVSIKARQLLDLEAEDPTFAKQFRKSSLNDALHHFMSVSASCFNHSDTQPSTKWIHIAMEFSLFAALESILILRLPAISAINDCFCYGTSKSPDSGDLDIDAMFKKDEDDEDSRDFIAFETYWDRTRDEALGKLHSPAPTHNRRSLVHQLLDLLVSLDWQGFKSKVVLYLTAVLESMPDPDLTKYSTEHGPLDRAVLRAPGMIAIAHEDGEIRNTKRPRVSA